MAEHAGTTDGALAAVSVRTKAKTADCETSSSTPPDPPDTPAVTRETGLAAERPSLRPATVLGALVMIALLSLTGWLGMRMYQQHQQLEQRDVFLQVARQGAVNLTNIDWQKADSDVQRILESSTGDFHDEFQQRSQPFIDVVKQAQSRSRGTITEAGLESFAPDEARVLIAIAVTTSTAGAPEQDPRLWRMRIDVQKDGESAKVAKVEFVP